MLFHANGAAAVIEVPAHRVRWNVRLQRVSEMKCVTTWNIHAMRSLVSVCS
jgi:hypothetical protein